MLPRAARAEGPERLPALRQAASGRRALNRPLRLLLTALLAAALLAGCGGDDEPEASPTRTQPDLTVPSTDPDPVPLPETETVAPAPVPPPETTPPSTDGGTPAPEAEPPADSPENDTPPPPDSPAERFEEFCNENPGACG